MVISLWRHYIASQEVVMNKNDQRQAARFEGAIPVETEIGEGLTRDFSNSGVFFETDKTYSPGQKIEFSFVLEHFISDRPMRVKCQGEIIRVEEKGRNVGVASTISSITFENIKKTNLKNDKIKKGVKK